jgi:hypothetical protein
MEINVEDLKDIEIDFHMKSGSVIKSSGFIEAHSGIYIVRSDGHDVFIMKDQIEYIII